jgi:hypothetical protein
MRVACLGRVWSVLGACIPPADVRLRVCPVVGRAGWGGVGWGGVRSVANLANSAIGLVLDLHPTFNTTVVSGHGPVMCQPAAGFRASAIAAALVVGGVPAAEPKCLHSSHAALDICAVQQWRNVPPLSCTCCVFGRAPLQVNVILIGANGLNVAMLVFAVLGGPIRSGGGLSHAVTLHCPFHGPRLQG